MNNCRKDSKYWKPESLFDLMIWSPLCKFSPVILDETEKTEYKNKSSAILLWKSFVASASKDFRTKRRQQGEKKIFIKEKIFINDDQKKKNWQN